VELTSRARDFSVLFELADSPPPLRGPSARCLFSPVLRVFVMFLLAFVFDPVLCQLFVAAGLRTVRASVTDGPDPVWMVRLVLADSPFFPVRLWWFWWHLRTVRGTWPDCPRGHCGPSAAPGRTVRQCLAALLLGSIPLSLLSCFRVCFKESFLRLEVDP
jgi:hypothetical protein